MHHETLEVFFGGAGGGGKSHALWLAALQYVTEPGYSALILRKTYPDLSRPGALMDRSRSYLRGTDARWLERDRRWTFPSGASISFGYLQSENDKYQYAGSDFQAIFFDELTHFTETQYAFLFTRLRKNQDQNRIPLRMRSASNPGSSGHQWVYKRFVDPRTRDKSRVFIPARIDDNPSLDRDEYRRSLANVDPLTRLQIESGDWNAVEGSRFRKSWFKSFQIDPFDSAYVIADDERFQIRHGQIFQTCDPAASASNKADNFVLSTWCVSPKGKLLWVGCHIGKYEIPEQVDVARRLYRHWRPQFLAVEEVLNQRALAQMLRRCIDPPMAIQSVNPKSRDKLQRSVGAAVLAESGRVYLPEPNASGGRVFIPDGDGEFPLEDVIGELITFTGEDGRADDIADTFFYAAELLPNLSSVGVGGPGHSPGVAGGWGFKR